MFKNPPAKRQPDASRKPAKRQPDATRAILFSPITDHTGFTGTSVWCDPRTDLCVVLLSNRVHPTRENALIQEVRRKLHDLVASRLEDRAPAK